MRPHVRFIFCCLCLIGCGGDAGDALGVNNSDGRSENNTNGSSNVNNQTPPEVERFLVREVAATDAYVFIPNASPGGSSVARVDARDLSVLPLQVGLNPKDVAAADIPNIGAVAYALCEGNQTVAIIRAEEPARDGRGIGDVRLLKLPREVNRLTVDPTGRTAVAWIDPDREIEQTAIASLQVLSLIRLGDTPEEDAVYDLSVTRLIRDLEFTETGELFLLGREGVNQIDIDAITSDTLIPKLDLGLEPDLFPAESLEMEVSPDARFLVLRSPANPAVVLYALTDDISAQPDPIPIALDGIPTDIDLVQTADGFVVLATVSTPDHAILINPAEVFPDPENYLPTVINAEEDIGLAQMTPDQSSALLYSTLPHLPFLSVLTLADESLTYWQLRNQIASVAISPDSSKAVVVHQRQSTVEEGPDALFQRSDGLTLIDLASGFRRPIVLQGKPIDLVMTESAGGTILYALLTSSIDGQRGVMRINMDTFRSDFVPLPKQPTQIGRVGEQVFVSQESEDGRITFFNVETNEQRTVSGYELNAIID